MSMVVPAPSSWRQVMIFFGLRRGMVFPLANRGRHDAVWLSVNDQPGAQTSRSTGRRVNRLIRPSAASSPRATPTCSRRSQASIEVVLQLLDPTAEPAIVRKQHTKRMADRRGLFGRERPVEARGEFR